MAVPGSSLGEGSVSDTCRRGHVIAEVGRYKHGGCKACVAERNKRYYADNKEAEQERYQTYYQANRDDLREKSRAWSAAHKDHRSAYNRAYHELDPEQRSMRWREWRYGLTAEDYTSLLEAQRGVCGICHTEPNSKPLAVDHDHETGAVRGLLCGTCNSGIGMLKDDAELLRRAVAWVETES